ANQKVANDPKFHKQLLEIAAEYQKYSKVDDMMRWAPGLCSLPPPPKARLSHSQDPGTHGKKLYYLYAKHRNAYMANQKDTAGQVVVKEAWAPPTADDVKAIDNQSQAKLEEHKKKFPNFGGNVDIDKPDALGPKSGLYIMCKADAKTPDTDEGWIYGTITA